MMADFPEPEYPVTITIFLLAVLFSTAMQAFDEINHSFSCSHCSNIAPSKFDSTGKLIEAVKNKRAVKTSSFLIQEEYCKYFLGMTFHIRQNQIVNNKNRTNLCRRILL